MNQDNDIQNFMGGLSEKISVFFDKNHDIAFLVFIGVFVFLLIGNILNWKWTYEPKSWVGYYWLDVYKRQLLMCYIIINFGFT